MDTFFLGSINGCLKFTNHFYFIFLTKTNHFFIYVIKVRVFIKWNHRIMIISNFDTKKLMIVNKINFFAKEIINKIILPVVCGYYQIGK